MKTNYTFLYYLFYILLAIVIVPTLLTILSLITLYIANEIVRILTVIVNYVKNLFG